jgi:hypothetical protein
MQSTFFRTLSKAKPLLPPFRLERHFEAYNHLSNITHLCASDTESITVRDALRYYGDEEVRKLWIEMDLEYTPVKGHPLLLEELSKMYCSYVKDPTTNNVPCSVSPSDIQELAPQEGILLGTLAFQTITPIALL